MTKEPKIKVGIVQKQSRIKGELNGEFDVEGEGMMSGRFSAEAGEGGIVFADASGHQIIKKEIIHMRPSKRAFFTLEDVAIGIDFHWERLEKQTFEGELTLALGDRGMITAINTIALEDYLLCVISSEMSSEAPLEFLKAHAIMSRSWLMSMLERRSTADKKGTGAVGVTQEVDEIIRWYGREDHKGFDVCADDHCQRYQGIGNSLNGHAKEACDATRGLFLIYDGLVCDARYHKCCGGLTDHFENTWENNTVPYLTSVADAPVRHKPIYTELDAQNWIMSYPEAYCNTTDERLLHQILPGFDQETADFYRWRVQYSREELEAILLKKSGIDFGTLNNIMPLERGPSGRIMRLRIEGSEKTMIVGKELEIRRCFSPSHLYSSAFIVITKRDLSKTPISFTFHGAGWGHGVGLCQIGAAVMAYKGFKAEEILQHYFHGAQLKKLY